MLRMRSPRVYANALNKFKLELNLNIAGEEFFAMLGDISETGLCAVVPVSKGAVLHTEIGADIEGVLLGKDLEEKMHFVARVAWQSMGTVGKQDAYLVGVEFHQPAPIPAPVKSVLAKVGD